MNHKNVYHNLINKAMLRNTLSSPFEKHHIKPKALFPDLIDDPKNIVKLTLREHFIAHLLLAKIYGGPMIFAAASMTNHGRYGNRQYEWLKKELSLFLSTSRMGENNPAFGKKQSEEHILKRLATKKMLNKPNPKKGTKVSEEARMNIVAGIAKRGGSFLGKKHSEETKQKISEAKKGKESSKKGIPLSENTKEKLREANLGKIVSEETKKKISATMSKIQVTDEELLSALHDQPSIHKALLSVGLTPSGIYYKRVKTLLGK